MCDFALPMENQIIILCTYAGETAVTAISDTSKFDELLQFVLGKWPRIGRADFSLTYKVPGYDKCMLDSEVDMVCMSNLARRMRLDHVDVRVLLNGTDSNTSDEESVGNVDGVQALQIAEMTDFEPDFCRHKQKLLMGSQWGHEIHGVGQKFEGGAEEYRRALCKFAVQIGFNFRYVKNDKTRVTVECTYREEKGCKWRLHASKSGLNGFFYIKSYMNIHTCGSVVRRSKHPRVNSLLVGDLMQEKIRMKPLYRPIDAIGDVKLDYGLDIKYHHAWLGVENARKEIYGDHSTSFDKLRWYFQEADRVNPGSHFRLDVDSESGRFRRCFVAFAACIHGYKFMRPMIFLDGTFLKGRHKGVVLGATCKTGDQEVYNLAFAVVGAEDNENWLWFLKELQSVVDQERKITFISDRHPGIIDGVKKVFPDCYHGFCLFHMKFNLADKLKGVHPTIRNRLVYKMNKCAYAPDREKYYTWMDSLINEGGQRVVDFFSGIPSENWCNAFFAGQRYGEMSSSLAELWNKMIDEARHMPITNMIDSIRVGMMEGIAKKRAESKKWNTILCPEMHNRLQKALDEGRTWSIRLSDENNYEVECEPSMHVNTMLRWCSCGDWQNNGFPCCHAAAVLNSSSQLTGKDLMEFIEPYFFVRYYQQALSMSIQPVATFGRPEMVLENPGILPPITRKLPGRPKKKRILSRGEKVRHIRCGRCGKKGRHNRKSCREIIST